MIHFNKVVGATWLLALGGLGGCSSDLSYDMGKRDQLSDEAKAHRWETDWAKDVEKAPNDPRIEEYVFAAGKPKCNLYICDMLYNVGITPPLTNDGKSLDSNGKWPITASMWTGFVPGWTKVTTQKKGDIRSNGTHCGIAVDETYTMAAGSKQVYMDKDINDGTIQRYDND
ncbi:MAG: hypothetical protein K2X94_01390 [Amoebophilaceae bacterium]|nr:hypothetical protein [Amoebophilaceae bacterium]